MPVDLQIGATVAKPVGPAATGGMSTTVLVLGVLGVAGYFVYRHFKKKGK